MRKLIGLVLFITVLCLGISGAIPHSTITVLGCEHGCKAAGAGYPLAFIIDNPDLSPVGSVSWMEMLMGVDRLDTVSLIISAVFWLLVSWFFVSLYRSLNRQVKQRWLYKAAISCGLVPLIASGFIFAVWKLSNSSRLSEGIVVFGLFVLMVGAALIAVGCILLVGYKKKTHTPIKALWLPIFALLINIPMAVFLLNSGYENHFGTYLVVGNMCTKNATVKLESKNGKRQTITVHGSTLTKTAIVLDKDKSITFSFFIDDKEILRSETVALYKFGIARRKIFFIVNNCKGLRTVGPTLY